MRRLRLGEARGQSVAGGAQSWGARSPWVDALGLAVRVREWPGWG